jgi:hypothetical protein
MAMWWQDARGDRWDFTSDASGVYLVGDAGVEGLHMPALTHYLTTAPSVPGSVWNGSDTNERQVIWPTRVWQDAGSEEWVEHDSRFWWGMNPRRTGRWFVQAPARKPRYLTLRYREDSTRAFSIDPALVGYANYVIVLAAEDPYWKGDTKRRTFSAAAEVDWLSTDPADGVFVISKSLNTSNAVITNQSDVEVYPQWIGRGPSTSMQIGVGSDTLTLDSPLSAGQWMFFDADPREQILWRGDNLDPTGMPVWDDTVEDITGDAEVSGFGVLDADVPTELITEIVGTGSITVQYVENFLRAW